MQTHIEAAFKRSVEAAVVPGADHVLYSLLVDSAAERQDAAALAEYAPLAEQTAVRISHRMYTAVAQRAWGVRYTLAGDYAKAEERLSQALEIFQAYPAPWQVGRTLFNLGQLKAAQAQPKQAREYFGRALEAFEGLRAAPYSARTRLALESLPRE